MAVYEAEVNVKLNKEGFNSDLKSVGNETEQAARSIDARAVAIGNVISQLATKAGQYFVQGAKMGIEYNAQIETYTTALTTALGNEAAAAAAIEQIKQDAARTPYSVDGLVKANSYLIMAGESAGDARATIMALGDAVSATGGGNAELQRMAQNLQQVKNVGKATSMDILQFGKAGIDVYGILADYTGKTTAEVQSLTITYDMLAGALQQAASEGGKYFQAMERQSQTLNGQWSTLKDNIQQKLGQAFESLSNTLSSKVLPAAIKTVQSLDFSNVAGSLQNLESAALAVGSAFAAVKIATIVAGWVTAFSAATAEMTATAVAEAALNGQLTIGQVLIGAMTGKITAATAAQALWNTVMAAAPLALLAGGIALIVASCVDYSNTLDNLAAQERNFGETSGEVAERLAALKAEYSSWKEQADNGATEALVYENMTQLEMKIAALEERYAELSAAEAAAGDSAAQAAGAFESLSGPIDTATSALTEMFGTTDFVVQGLANVIQQHDKLHENITKKVQSWFGLFDEAKTTVKTSVKDMMSNMQSQIDFNTRYSSNLDYLAANGLSNLGEAFQSMGAEGAAYADALVQAIEDAGGATSEGGQEIINNFSALAEGVANSQEGLSNSLTDITGTLESQLAQWGASAEQAAQALNVSGSASASAAASVNAYIAGIAAGAPRAGAAASAVARAASAGFGSSRGGGHGGIASFAVGADYIPYDNFPALLHKGEMVIPAEISNDLRDFVGKGGRSPQPVTSVSGGSGNGEIISLLKELISATSRPIVLDDGTLVGHTASKMDNALGDVGSLRGRGLCLA